jgi:ATP-dependent RNA helicase RhlE
VEEKAYLRDIEKLINQKIPVIKEHPFLDFNVDETTETLVRPKKPQQSRRPKQRRWSNSQGSGGGANSHRKGQRTFSRKKP